MDAAPPRRPHTNHQNQRTVETPEVDRRLYRKPLWEAREGLLKRWKRQRLNRKLRLRMAHITQARDYATELTQQNWVQFCTSLKGTLSTAKTWAILRCLIEPDKAKSTTSRTLQEIAHKFPGNDQDLIDTIKTRYPEALGLPFTTSNEKLAALGIHNTFAELSDAVMASAKARLQNTAAGRAILHRTGTATVLCQKQDQGEPHTRHMSHELLERRRKARVDRQRRQFKGDLYVTYVDVAAYPAGGIFAVAAVNDNSLTFAASVSTETPAAAETIAAALVIK
ncbi:hypothetical protein HPB49_012133 [Dermacentor silvarum]|uniref:Uncharacterized protein n=1 Tax=Dermacentor silvarum TaxID=543639 RepID=A0ACB8DD20_DERSI|nr:hypothetical protein HPB49_012133 [Dermacentor silvarum]